MSGGLIGITLLHGGLAGYLGFGICGQRIRGSGWKRGRRPLQQAFPG